MTKIKVFIVLFILVVGLILRLNNYYIYPQRGASSDEYTYSFLGISLINKHYPESWSNLNAYPNLYDLTIDHLYFPMVYPYFDHPPLNGLLVGAWSIINGQNNYREIDLKTIRLIPIFLYLISAILVFLIAFRLYGYRVASTSLLIFSASTVFAMNQRVVFAENLLTPIFLGAMYLYIRTSNLTLKKGVTLGILSGLAFWTKEVGIIVFITLLFLMLKDVKKIKPILIFVMIFLIFFLGYFFYGNIYDWDLFWKIISIQSARKIGPETILLLLSKPIIVNKLYFDGWYFLGFVSLFIGLTDIKKYGLIVIPAFLYFLLMVFSLAKEGEMGWYMIPMFPFMSIIISKMTTDGLKNANWYIFLIIIFVGLFQIKYLYEANFGLTQNQFRIIMLIMLGPLLLAQAFKSKRIFTQISFFWFYLLIIGTIFLTYTYIHPA